MDLAMPGIDGWETIRRLRAERLSDAPIAIVSANAFEKGVDNEAGIPPDDFIVKPVRKAELLDWLGRALQIDWIIDPAAVEPKAAKPAMPALVPHAPVLPRAEQVQALQAVIEIGYLRGILRELDRIEADEPRCAPFAAQMRALARNFQLDAMSRILQRAAEPAAGAAP